VREAPCGKIVLTATLNNYESFMAFIDGQLFNLEIDESDKTKILTACEEIIVNVIHYAYSNHEDNLEILFEYDLHNVIVTFIDSGKAFNPIAIPDADITLSLDEREVGGLGILMVKKLMDEVKYEYRNNQNVFTIIKYITMKLI
jgi:anti-sigma regulatory factor (Ser/Thr protein kinase)